MVAEAVSRAVFFLKNTVEFGYWVLGSLSETTAVVCKPEIAYLLPPAESLDAGIREIISPSEFLLDPLVWVYAELLVAIPTRRAHYIQILEPAKKSGIMSHESLGSQRGGRT